MTARRGYTSADWSPDGRRIAFTGGSGEGDAYLINTDGSGIVRLTRNAQTPDWSPDGRRLAFVRYPAIYVMKANGTNQRRIAPSPAGPSSRVERTGPLPGGPHDSPSNAAEQDLHAIEPERLRFHHQKVCAPTSSAHSRCDPHNMV